MIENIGIMCGIVLGLFGSVFSVVQFFYQKKVTERQEKEQAQRDKEQAEKQGKKDRLEFLKMDPLSGSGITRLKDVSVLRGERTGA